MEVKMVNEECGYRRIQIERKQCMQQRGGIDIAIVIDDLTSREEDRVIRNKNQGSCRHIISHLSCYIQGKHARRYSGVTCLLTDRRY